MCKVDLEGFPYKIDYVYSIYYGDSQAQALPASDSMVECNLTQRQRSSQEILALADFISIHCNRYLLRKHSSRPSFKSETPKWIQLANESSFFKYFRDKFYLCSRKTEDKTLLLSLITWRTKFLIVFQSQFPQSRGRRFKHFFNTYFIITILGNNFKSNGRIFT